MTKIFIAFFICTFTVTLQGTAQTKTDSIKNNEYYLEVIANETGSTNFTIGAYPSSISHSKRGDGSIFTIMKIAMINDKEAQPFVWNDYKIYVLLKNGQLFYNFLANSTNADYSCKYTVNPGETHIQFCCFEKIFAMSEIDKIWLSFSDYQFFQLYKYTDEQVQTQTPAAPSNNKKPVKK